jgi:hypothetical protein
VPTGADRSAIVRRFGYLGYAEKVAALHRGTLCNGSMARHAILPYDFF